MKGSHTEDDVDEGEIARALALDEAVDDGERGVARAECAHRRRGGAGRQRERGHVRRIIDNDRAEAAGEQRRE